MMAIKISVIFLILFLFMIVSFRITENNIFKFSDNSDRINFSFQIEVIQKSWIDKVMDFFSEPVYADNNDCNLNIYLS